MGIFDSFKLAAGEEISRQIKENLGSISAVQDIASWAGQKGVDSAQAIDIVKNVTAKLARGDASLQSISTTLFAEFKNAGAGNLNLEQVSRKISEVFGSTSDLNKKISG